MAMFNVQWAIIQKVGKPEFCFICSAFCLMVLYICVKFCEYISNGIRVIERTQVHGRNGYVQRAGTPKVDKPELRFMCSARRLMVLYICVQFHEKISNGIRVMQ